MKKRRGRKRMVVAGYGALGSGDRVAMRSGDWLDGQAEGSMAE